MDLLLSILRIRRRRKIGDRESPYKTLVFICMAIFISSTIMGIAVAFLGFQILTYNLPSLELLPKWIEPPGGLIFHPTRLFDRSGKHVLMTLENPASSGFQYLPLGENNSQHLSLWLPMATVELVDPQYWKKPMLSISPQTALYPFPFSERLVDDFLLWHDTPGILKDIRKKYLSAQLIQHYGRERLLEWYLNSTNYGRLAYGADAAARVYFGKSASQLSLAEAALLAVCGESPALNPIDAPQAAKDQQVKLIKQMLQDKMISPEEADQALNAQIDIRAPVEWQQTSNSFFNQYAIKELVGQFGWERLERGGFEVITTLDYDLQLQTNCTAQLHIARLMGKSAGSSIGEQTACHATNFLSSLPSSQSTTPDNIGIEAVILDPKTGQILTMISSKPKQWDSSIQDGRPAGSILTPFVYLSAFTHGYTPASLTWDIPASSSGQNIPHYLQKYLGPIRLRYALANDILATAVKIYNQISGETVWHTAREMGLYIDSGQKPIKEDIFWQGGQVHLLELIQAYAVFANQGIQAGNVKPNPNIIQSPELLNLSPSVLLTVKDQEQKTWLDWQSPKTKSVITPALAYIMNNLLGDDIARWDSLGHPNPLDMDQVSAVKLGRTLDGKDNWAIGYSSAHVVGVWIGALDKYDAENLPATAAAPLWNALLQYADRNSQDLQWPVPAGIAFVDVCDPSGMLPNNNCPNIIREVFLEDNRPDHTDTLYYTLPVNRFTGKLATIFTPLDMVENKSFMNIPPSALSWAKQQKLSIPPRDYDILYSPYNMNSQVRFTYPAQLQVVHGKVTLTGFASDDNFSRYRIQIGKGINPQEWIKLEDDIQYPVQDGTLAVWDTDGINGLYVIQLLVIKNDRSVEIATRQVIIDNRSPEIHIRYPDNGQVIQDLTQSVMFQADIKDDIEIDKVEFTLNDKPLTILMDAPFVYTYGLINPGHYHFQVKASDTAGNVTFQKVEFIIAP